MLKYLLTACMAVFPLTANSALLERLGGLAYYDTDADLTWLANANAGAGSIYDDDEENADGKGPPSENTTTDGQMRWYNANDWVTNLDVAGVTGWRLPEKDVCCSGSEMHSLFYNVLGGVEGESIFDTHNSNYYLFSNIQADDYWLNSVGCSGPSGYECTDVSISYSFNTIYGIDGWIHNEGPAWNVWAVHDGDVGAVPIPAAVWLFGSGLIGLIGIARRKKA